MSSRRLVVVAPDSFKGSLSAAAAAASIREGWLTHRPDDEVRTIPLADGGEGTAAAIHGATAGSLQIAIPVTGPDGRPQTAHWTLLPDGTAVVESAVGSGLLLMAKPDPLQAHSFGFGQLLSAAALDPRTRRIVATLGGSASTDGGAGALRALGVRFLDERDEQLPDGGGALAHLHLADASALLAPPVGGVVVLTDVSSPLCGTHGAATVFGPQKGASAADVEQLEAALHHYATVIGGDPEQPGAGAAGGSGFGLATLWGAELAPGAPAVAAIVGLQAAWHGADLVITGEGRFDEQSLRGKVIGHVLAEARCPVALVAGGVLPSAEATAALARFAGVATLTELAGSTSAAMASPVRWAHAAGKLLAHQLFG